MSSHLDLLHHHNYFTDEAELEAMKRIAKNKENENSE